MHIGQIILLVSLLLLAIYVIMLRTALSDRLLILATLGLGILFILWPNLTTRIANFLGIGRGTDLLFYLFIVLSLFFFVYVLSELNRQLRTITAMAREIALMTARLGKAGETPRGEPPADQEASPPAGMGTGAGQPEP